MTLRGILLSRVRRRGVAVMWLGCAAVLAALLTATMYWTLFDPRWITFLGGVLLAGVLSMASQVSRAQWALARRARQVERLRARLEETNSRSAGSTAAFTAAAMRLRRLGDVLRSAVLFVDRGEVCRFHNATAARKLARDGDAVDGRALCDLLGSEVYAAVQPHLAASFAGEAASYRLQWRTPASEQVEYAVRQLPAAAGDAAAEACLLFTPVQATGAIDGHAEVHYLNALSRELTGWDDPKGKLTRALAEDRFLLMEQRIVPLELGREDPLCAEILLRLQEEEDHLLPPGGFLPEAERLGMMEELDRWVVRRLITLRQEQLRACPAGPALLSCINLSPAAVRSEHFARFVQSQIERRGFDGRALCFEIAEHDVITLRLEVERLIAMLKPFGCRFTVDGFGSAKGSFAALNALAFDFIKIDGVIVQNMLRDPAVRARAAAINTACHRIGVRTIAEFVEDQATLGALRRLGVDYAQGFGIGRPAPLCAPPAAAVAAA